MQQPPAPKLLRQSHDAEMAGPFPPDLHDVRHLRLKACLLLVWAVVSFGAAYFARDLQFVMAGGWPFGYWVAAQGAVLVFIVIVAVYAWAMNHFERQDARRVANQAAALTASVNADAAVPAPGMVGGIGSDPDPAQATRRAQPDA
jgi:putative solute:sodium symporter small subunit